MRTQSDIERDVKAELQWQPEFDATNVAVSVKDGVVTLTGFVRHYRDKYLSRPQRALRASSESRTTSKCACPASTRNRIPSWHAKW